MFLTSLLIAGITLVPASEYDFEIEEVDLIDEVLYNSTIQEFTTSTYKPIPIDRIDWVFEPTMKYPVDVPEISSDFGYRSISCGACSSYHEGVDFVPGNGEPVYAAMDGMIIDIDYAGSYGYYVVINHILPFESGIENWQTVYAHLQMNSEPEDLVIGSVVKAGDQIGLVGNTGVSTGPHLHFEIVRDGERVDPEPLLKRYHSY